MANNNSATWLVIISDVLNFLEHVLKIFLTFKMEDNLMEILLNAKHPDKSHQLCHLRTLPSQQQISLNNIKKIVNSCFMTIPANTKRSSVVKFPFWCLESHVSRPTNLKILNMSKPCKSINLYLQFAQQNFNSFRAVCC